MSRLMQEEKGSVAVLLALAMVVLIGFSALAIDVGYLFFRKSEMMSIADAASLAGAVAMRDSAESEEHEKTVAIEAAVTNNLQANGFNEPVIFEHDAEEPGSEPNTVYVLPEEKQVHVNLSLPESWLFAKVLSLSAGGALDEPAVGSQSRAEVVSKLGVNLPDHAIISFDKDDGVVYFNGDVNITGNNDFSVHSNKILSVKGKKDGDSDVDPVDPVGYYVDDYEGNHILSLFTGGLHEAEPLVSPFAHLLPINSKEELRDAFPGADCVSYYTGGINGSIDLPKPDDPSYHNPGVRVIYIKGDIDVQGNINVSIETNGGLVIVEGFMDFSGEKFNVDGIIYTTENIKIHGSSVSISGGLWSEKRIELKGTVDSFSYNPLDISLGPQEETFSIKMVR